jgi:hypothetical protein
LTFCFNYITIQFIGSFFFDKLHIFAIEPSNPVLCNTMSVPNWFQDFLSCTSQDKLQDLFMIYGNEIGYKTTLDTAIITIQMFPITPLKVVYSDVLLCLYIPNHRLAEVFCILEPYLQAKWKKDEVQLQDLFQLRVAEIHHELQDITLVIELFQYINFLTMGEFITYT